MNDLDLDAGRPVEGDLIVNRVAEFRRLDVALRKLRAGRADYLSVLVLRKQGKSSLFQEWMRRHAGSRDVAFVAVPCQAWPGPESGSHPHRPPHEARIDPPPVDPHVAHPPRNR